VLIEAPLYSEASNAHEQWTSTVAAEGLSARWGLRTGVPYKEIVGAASAPMLS
jgi:hypothetical protein